MSEDIETNKGGVRIKVVGLRELRRKIEEEIARAPAGIQRALMRAGLLVAGAAQKNVTGGGHSTTQLNVRTGRLRASIQPTLVARNTVAVGSNVAYAAIHEFGGVTPPRDIRPRARRALRFAAGSNVGIRKLGPLKGAGARDWIFAKVVHHPGSRVPPRPYLRPALRNNRLAVLEELRKVYAGLVKFDGPSR